jgi:hypothetical protein
MKFIVTHDSPQGREKSKYFETLTADLIRQYGKEKGTRLANRYWDIKNKIDHKLQEERTKIVMGLA